MKLGFVVVSMSDLEPFPNYLSSVSIAEVCAWGLWVRDSQFSCLGVLHPFEGFMVQSHQQPTTTHKKPQRNRKETTRNHDKPQETTRNHKTPRQPHQPPPQERQPIRYTPLWLASWLPAVDKSRQGFQVGRGTQGLGGP